MIESLAELYRTAGAGKFRWPEGFQSAAVFSFDVDGSCMQQLMDGNTLGNHSVGDYGPKIAVPRIMDLMDKYDIKAMFYVPGWTAERYPYLVQEIHRRGHEVGSHGYLHENFSRLSEAEETEIHDKSMKIMTDIVGVRPRSFRCPGGPLTDRTIKNLYERGYDCDSSSVNDYFPSRVKIDGKEVAMAEVPWSWLVDDFGYFWGGAHVSAFGSGRATVFNPLMSPKDVAEYWLTEFDGVHQLGGLFTVLNHPRAIGRVARLRALEKVILRIKETPGVWLTNIRSVADWVLVNSGEESKKNEV